MKLIKLSLFVLSSIEVIMWVFILIVTYLWDTRLYLYNWKKTQLMNEISKEELVENIPWQNQTCYTCASSKLSSFLTNYANLPSHSIISICSCSPRYKMYLAVCLYSIVCCFVENLLISRAQPIVCFLQKCINYYFWT